MGVDGTTETTEELFDCVICGQTSTSTEGRPIGLVALLQPSAGKVAYCYLLFLQSFFFGGSKITVKITQGPKSSERSFLK